MALVETLDPTDINLALQNAFEGQLEWQMPRRELENRLDAAAYAAARVLNAPYYEEDLSPEERAEAERVYAQSAYPIHT